MSAEKKKVKEVVQIGTCGWGWRGTVEAFLSLVDQFVKVAEARGMTDLEIVLESDSDYDGCSNVDFTIEGMRDETDEELHVRQVTEKINSEKASLLHFGVVIDWARQSIQLGTAKLEDFEIEYVCTECESFNESIKMSADSSDIASVRAWRPCKACGKLTENLPALLFKGENI